MISVEQNYSSGLDEENILNGYLIESWNMDQETNNGKDILFEIMARPLGEKG